MSATIDLVHSSTPSSVILSHQVERILRSHTFSGSEVLRNLLSFLAACALEGRAESVKVREIATVVFGRSEHFDSQSDSVVRVHTGRLRSKLAEYYVDEGAEDEVILSIPKGSYAVSWHARHHAATAPVAPAPPETVTEPTQPVPASTGSRLHFPYVGLVFALMVLSSGVTFWATGLFRGEQAGLRNKPALRTFWSGFIANNETPLIVFSNLKLVGSVRTGMRLYREEDHGDSVQSDRDQPVIDTYTTVGEVMGVFDVSNTLASFHKSARAKHGQLLTWDDAKDSNLIFVGGPLADTPLSQISVFREFQFSNKMPGVPAQSGAIVNLHPRKGEASIYLGPESRPFQFDYAVISLRPAFDKTHRILALAGITEYGTGGAAEFVTREEQVSELLSRLNVKPDNPIPWFEALLRVSVNGGVPVKSEIVLVHRVS